MAEIVKVVEENNGKIRAVDWLLLSVNLSMDFPAPY